MFQAKICWNGMGKCASSVGWGAKERESPEDGGGFEGVAGEVNSVTFTPFWGWGAPWGSCWDSLSQERSPNPVVVSKMKKPEIFTKNS
jgi:hypothetical protein